MKKKLTLEQRADRADRIALGFELLFVADLCATVAFGLAAIFFLDMLKLGLCCLCLFTAVVLKDVAAHLKSRAVDLELQRFEEQCNLCSATDISDPESKNSTFDD